MKLPKEVQPRVMELSITRIKQQKDTETQSDPQVPSEKIQINIVPGEPHPE